MLKEITIVFSIVLLGYLVLCLDHLELQNDHVSFLAISLIPTARFNLVVSEYPERNPKHLLKGKYWRLIETT